VHSPADASAGQFKGTGVMMRDTRDEAKQEREAELRQRLRSHGYELRRSPVQDPQHPAYGGYMIVDANRHVIVAGYEPFAFSHRFDRGRGLPTDISNVTEEPSHDGDLRPG